MNALLPLPVLPAHASPDLGQYEAYKYSPKSEANENSGLVYALQDAQAYPVLPVPEIVYFR
jgi:hypothetical protein